MRTVVYVDGFNLYYGALKGTPFRWLDLERLTSVAPDASRGSGSSAPSTRARRAITASRRVASNP